MTTHEPQPYDVWLMWVEFPDHPGIGKVRPVVITETDGNAISGVAAKITGNTTWNDVGDIPLLDWRQAGLYKPSMVRCAQRFTFLRSDLKERFGELSDRDAANVAIGLELTKDARPYGN